jgi:hypothetical protein
MEGGRGISPPNPKPNSAYAKALMTINQSSWSENALKLTYGKVEFQNFLGEEWERRGVGK